MKVYCYQPEILSPFERQVAQKLWEIAIDGYALIGFVYTSKQTNVFHQIDIVLITHSGILGCGLIRGATGIWTGTINSAWKADDTLIDSDQLNPQKQVLDWALLIRDGLVQDLFYQTSLFVHTVIVVPDQTTIEIATAEFNQIAHQGKTINICQLSALEQALQALLQTTSSSASVRSTRQRLTELGLETVVTHLVNLSVEDLNNCRLTPSLLLEASTGLPKRISSQPTPIEPVASEPLLSSHPALRNQDSRNRKGLIPITLVAGGLAVGIYLWQSAPVEPELQIESPLTIGVMTDPEAYEDLSIYLQEALTGHLHQELDIQIEGNDSITYQAAKNNIARNNWDLVFAYSPMNGVIARDNDYVWVARMFPNYPNYYQSALFVRQDSSIQSMADITDATRVALGQIGSASKFFMPIYTLYGKTITLDHDQSRSQDIIDQVRWGQADVGAVAKAEIEADRDFRIIQTSRDIPGSGVYLSPQLSPEAQALVSQILLAAPEPIQQAANYGVGAELDYEAFREITLKTEELLACVDLDEAPVRLFCQDAEATTPESGDLLASMTGQINGWSRISDQTVQLTLSGDDGQIYQLLIDLALMSQIPNCTSPTVCNQKRIEINDVQVQNLTEGVTQLQIVNANQIYVF